MNSGLKATLTISLVLNVLLAGMLLGDVSHNLIGPASPAFDINAQLARLPQDQHNLFSNILGPVKTEIDASRSKMDEAKKVAIQLLTNQPFNEDAYLAQVHRIEDIHTRMKLRIATSLATLARQLTTPLEREVLSNIVSHPPFVLPPQATTGGEKP